MKTRKLIAVIAVALITGSAFAGDFIPTTVTTAKGSQGQQVVLYRPNCEISLALYTGSGHGARRVTTATGNQQ